MPSTVDDLVQRLATAEPVDGPTPVIDQHMVSQAHAKPWTVEDPDGVARLQPFPVDHPERRRKRQTPKGIAYVRNWCDFGSGTMEGLWKETEDQIPALRAAVEDGTLYQHPHLVDAARDLIALCYTRTARLREQHDQWHNQNEENLGQLFASAGHTGPAPTASHCSGSPRRTSTVTLGLSLPPLRCASSSPSGIWTRSCSPMPPR
ncbi:hypothetical protein [Kitasatospora sp. NPDC127035]|uniref:hypothetical protein n=1 Tax=Kitasatospora sp. NPDC127035 TaxID=3347111 RepID=UPI00365831B4